MTTFGSAVHGWRRLLVAGVMTAVGATGLVASVDRTDPCGPHAVTSGGGIACLAIDERTDLAGAPDRDVLLGEVARRATGPGVAHMDDPAAGDGEVPPLELVCDRSSSRRRVEVLYGHAPGAEDLAARRDELEDHVRFAQLQYDFSAFAAGSERAWVPRFVTEGTGEDCRVRITPVELSDAAMARLDIPYAELEQQGYADPERAYLLFVDDGPYCGMGTIETERTGPDSDHPDPEVNPNNARRRAAYTRIDEPCWGLAEAHELGHNLGAVQQSAPNSTAGAHCTDGYDAMCYDDGSAGSGGYNEKACPDELLYFALDCNGDDYYAPVPAPGSYLASHWNIVDNDWLLETFTDAVIVGLTVGPTGTRFDDVTLDDVFVHRRPRAQPRDPRLQRTTPCSAPPTR